MTSIYKMIDYTTIITLEPGKRSGKPCIRGLRITIYDVLSYLAAGMTPEEILSDFPSLTQEDILACLADATSEINPWGRASVIAGNAPSIPCHGTQKEPLQWVFWPSRWFKPSARLPA